jgi:hypothetical protein
MCTVLLPPGVNPIAVNKYIMSYHMILKIATLFFNTVVGACSFVLVCFSSILPSGQFNVASMIFLIWLCQSAHCHCSDVCFKRFGIAHSLTDLTSISVCWKDCRSAICLSFATRNIRIFSRWNDNWINITQIFIISYSHILFVDMASEITFVNKQLWIYESMVHILVQAVPKTTSTFYNFPFVDGIITLYRRNIINN